MSDQYEKGVLKVLRYVYNQMERCRNADFDALGITSSQASVMMFLFKNRKHEVTQQSVGLSQEELDNLEKSLCVIAENLRKEEDMLAAERIIQDIKERTKEEEKEEKD